MGSFSGDGQRILTSAKDGTVKLWSAEGVLLMNQKTGMNPVGLFFPDGRQMLTLPGTPQAILCRSPRVAYAALKQSPPPLLSEEKQERYGLKEGNTNY